MGDFVRRNLLRHPVVTVFEGRRQRVALLPRQLSEELVRGDDEGFTDRVIGAGCSRDDLVLAELRKLVEGRLDVLLAEGDHPVPLPSVPVYRWLELESVVLLQNRGHPPVDSVADALVNYHLGIGTAERLTGDLSAQLRQVLLDVVLEGLEFAEVLEGDLEDLHRVVAPLGEDEVRILAREVVVGAIMLEPELDLVDRHPLRWNGGGRRYKLPPVAGRLLLAILRWLCFSVVRQDNPYGGGDAGMNHGN